MSQSKPLAVSRRDLFTVAGVCGVSAMTSGCTSIVGKNAKELQSFCASCTMECLHCNLRAFVGEDGKVVRIESDNPYEGKGCARGLSRIQWIYAKNRVLTPLKRIGERGEGKFEPISWDEALDTIAEKIKWAIAKDGSKSILITAASGNMDNLSNPVTKTFGAYLGGTCSTVGSLCCSAVTAAMSEMVGLRYADTRDTIADAKYILCWGNNPMVTMQAYWPRYLKAMEDGAKLVVIDPRKSETAARAHQWVAPNPGTDAALGLGMIRVIAHEKLYDEAFLKAHTGAVYLTGSDGKLLRENEKDKNSYLVFDEISKKLVRHDKPGISPALCVKNQAVPAGVKTVLTLLFEEAEKWTPQATEKETRVPADTVVQLARDYAKSKASMIICNMGSFQRVENGTYAVAAHFYLAMLTGNIGRAGTGVCDAGGVTQMTKFGAPIPAPKNKPAKVEGIPTAKLGEYILNDKPHKINFWYSQTCAPVGQWPNTNKVIAAIKKVPFFVVADSLMTPTAMYADIVLPATTVFEYKSLLAGARTHYVQWSEQAVEPQGQARPDYWIMRELAKRFDFAKAFDLTPEEMARNVLKPSGIKLEDVIDHPVCPVKGPWIPFENGIFRTPTGKGHFYAEGWAKKGFKPILTYIRANESPKGNPTLARKYPLQAIQRKVIRNIHTSHQDNVWINHVFGNEPTVWMNTIDAKKRGLTDGQMVVVYNDRGEHKARAVVSDNIIEGVVCLENGWWQGKNGFTTSSVLTNDTIEVLGSATTICSTLVNVKGA